MIAFSLLALVAASSSSSSSSKDVHRHHHAAHANAGAAASGDLCHRADKPAFYGSFVLCSRRAFAKFRPFYSDRAKGVDCESSTFEQNIPNGTMRRVASNMAPRELWSLAKASTFSCVAKTPRTPVASARLSRKLATSRTLMQVSPPECLRTLRSASTALCCAPSSAIASKFTFKTRW